MAKKKALRLLDEASLRKKYSGLANSARNIISHNEHVLRIPSRLIWFNYQLGGGLVYGKTHELFGYESTGKTLLALDFAFVTQSLGGVVLWDDAEQAFNHNWAIQNGLNPDLTEIYDSNDLEGFADWFRDWGLYYRAKLVNNEPILVVVDSIAALDILENLEVDMKDGKAEYSGVAKKLNQFYRKRIKFCERYGITLLMINQLRPKIGATIYEVADVTPGGKATAFYSSIRIGINRGKALKGLISSKGWKEDREKGVKVGQNVYIDIIKNKTAPPRNKVKTIVYFLPDRWGHVGYSRYEGLPDILEYLKVLKKKGSRYYFKEAMIANGEASLVKRLYEDEDLRKKLIRKSGINTISKTRGILESIGKNLYPVKAKTSSSDDEDDSE